MKILMVCLGNICRSPLAQGILEYNASKENKSLFVDSAATSNYHIGHKPDARSIAVAKQYGIDISSQRGRQFTISDFESFDIIFAMDSSIFYDLNLLTKNETHRQKIRMIMNELEPNHNANVPDPYYGDKEGFETVFQMLDKATKAFLKNLNKN